MTSNGGVILKSYEWYRGVHYYLLETLVSWCKVTVSFTWRWGAFASFPERVGLHPHIALLELVLVT